MADKLKLAVFKFASCDGCQLSLLCCEEELLAVADAVEIAYFLEARTATSPGPYDIGLVEGSITTPHDARRIREVRAQCKLLVAIGACATAGGIQSLRNWAEIGELTATTYANPQYIETLASSTPIADHVTVDFELRGCPISKRQLLETLATLVRGGRPRTSDASVCLECKARGVACVAVADGLPCLGPVTQAGCGAVCPAYGRGCFGCYGPQQRANLASLTGFYRDRGATSQELVRLTRSFNGYAPEFRAASEALEAAMQPPSCNPAVERLAAT